MDYIIPLSYNLNIRELYENYSFSHKNKHSQRKNRVFLVLGAKFAKENCSKPIHFQPPAGRFFSREQPTPPRKQRKPRS